MRYQTKRQYVEAERFFISHKPWPKGVKTNVGLSSHTRYYYVQDGAEYRGNIMAGEWIVKINGNLYIISNASFNTLYEPVPTKATPKSRPSQPRKKARPSEELKKAYKDLRVGDYSEKYLKTLKELWGTAPKNTAAKD